MQYNAEQIIRLLEGLAAIIEIMVGLLTIAYLLGTLLGWL